MQDIEIYYIEDPSDPVLLPLMKIYSNPSKYIKISIILIQKQFLKNEQIIAEHESQCFQNLQ